MRRRTVATVAVMVLAAAAGTAALVLLVTGPREVVPPPQAPPLALGPQGLTTATPGPAPGLPLTTRLVVPAGGIDLAVVQGDGVTVPLNLAIHYPGTDQPGGGSNALYYAHARPGMFGGLYRVHKGDLIEAMRADGSEVTYHIAVIEFVPYNDDSVLKPTSYDEVTLLTCTSYDTYTPRLIVIGLPGTA